MTRLCSKPHTARDVMPHFSMSAACMPYAQKKCLEIIQLRSGRCVLSHKFDVYYANNSSDLPRLKHQLTCFFSFPRFLLSLALFPLLRIPLTSGLSWQRLGKEKDTAMAATPKNMQRVDRESLYTSLPARIQYLHSFLEFGPGK